MHYKFNLRDVIRSLQSDWLCQHSGRAHGNLATLYLPYVFSPLRVLRAREIRMAGETTATQGLTSKQQTMP